MHCDEELMKFVLATLCANDWIAIIRGDFTDSITGRSILVGSHGGVLRTTICALEVSKVQVRPATSERNAWGVGSPGACVYRFVVRDMCQMQTKWVEVGSPMKPFQLLMIQV